MSLRLGDFRWGRKSHVVDDVVGKTVLWGHPKSAAVHALVIRASRVVVGTAVVDLHERRSQQVSFGSGLTRIAAYAEVLEMVLKVVNSVTSTVTKRVSVTTSAQDWSE